MEADALISKAEGCNVAGLYTELRRHLEPLSGLVEFEGRKKQLESTEQIRVLAKRYVQFLGRLLKVSSNNLIRGKSSSETDQKRADELFRVLKLVVACYDTLRPCLLGIPYEIEKQRYWMARRLMAWERFTEAREECWVTLHSLKVNIFCKSEKGKKEVVASARKGSVKKKDVTTSSTRKKDIVVSARKTIEKGTDNYGIDLYGELAETADSGLVELVLGLVTDLIICTGESKLKEVDEYRKVLVLIEQLVPWQRVSDKNAIEKHRSMLFKGLQKCVLFMISKPSYFDAKLTRTFVMLSLDSCACSSVKNEFIKVTCRICRQLVSGAHDHSSMVVDICKLTLSTIFKGLQQQIYGQDEIIDAVEFYCNYCETSSKLTKDAEQFLHAIADSCAQALPFHLSAALHIYGVGMGFKGFEVSCLGDDGVEYIESEISEVRSCAKNDDKELLSSLVQKIQNMVEEFQKSLEDSEYGKNESVISIFRALEFLSKASAQCVKQEWDFFVANAAKCRPSAWFNSLEQTFLIFSRIFLAVLSCDPIPLEEKKELRRSCQMVLLAATSALKLALMYQKNSQEIFEIIETLTSGDFILVDELKWLSNCTYSIGVRMFNNKRFDLASNPLKMACTAAWRRISCVMNGSLDDCVESESISELICDACAKSVVLVDAAHRSGSPLLKEMIIDFLTQWSSADSRLSSMNSRHALVKHWVKIVCEDSKDMELNEALVDCPTLYEVLTDTSSTWPVETLGVLLEEELLAYASIETNFSRLVQKRIFKLLLEDVYVTKEFALERSRVLLEQCKAARLIGSDGLDKCLDCLSDAMSILKKELDENLFPSGKSYHMDCVRHQLAITYCVHACCIQELKSDSKVILGDISSALKLWSCIFSSEFLDSNKEQKDWMFDTSIPLLINISQLLALKGFVSLQSEVQGMILHILSALKKIGPEKCCALLWRESRLNHTICCIPFSASIFSTLIDKVGNAINSLRFWENSLNDHLGCLLEFQQKLMCDLFIEVQADIDFSADSFFRSLGTNSIELLKDRVLTLASNGQKSIEFSSVTSNLFYILSEKCRTNGKLSEALKYSNEALRIRRRQLQKCFKYVGKDVHFAFNNEMGGFSLEARGSVATNVWLNVSDNGKHEYQTSQWIVLGNYLESLMQVGVLYEIAGAANEAEYVFHEGLNISNAQDLPLCQAAFGSSLGEIHRKCHKWEIAEKRFQEAMKVLGRPDLEHMCKLCKVTIEATLEMRIGDLVRRCPRESFAVNFYKELTSAFDIYMLAKEKLNNIKRNYSDDMPLDRKMHTKCFDSNSRACKEGNAASSPELESDPLLYSVRKSNKTDSIQELLAFSFELHWRSLMSRLLLQIGKCYETSGEFLKAYEIMLQNTSLLSFHIDGLPCLCSFVNGHHCQQKCPGWKIPVDILLFERAALLYHISWFCLKKNLPVLSWTQCCSPSENLRSFVIGWLHHAFFICNQMPALLRKVSILLAIVHMPLALGGLCSISEDYNSNLSGSHWSAYFHQASLGTTLREEHLAVLDAKLASQDSDSSQVAETRFASNTIVLRRLVKVRESLASMVISQSWSLWRQSSTERATNVKRMILDDTWWERVEYLLSFTEPIMSMIRYTDTDHPCLGEVYDGIDSMLEKMRHIINQKEQDPEETFFKEVQTICVERWNKMTTPLHLLAFALTPKFYSDEILAMPSRVPPYRDVEVSEGCRKALTKLFPDREMENIVTSEFADFVASNGQSASALRDKYRKDAHAWWYLNGHTSPHLQTLAIKILSQASQHNNSREVIERVQKVLRLTPDELDYLEPFVTDFFRSVPLPTIVCISFLDCRYASILESSSFTNSSPAWIFLTRFDSDGPPVVLLLPIRSTFNGTKIDAVEGSNLCSPFSIWNLEADNLKANDIRSTSEVMDVVAEEFHLLLEESRLSTSDALSVATNDEKMRWWQWRKQLDDRLGNLIRGIEDCWLGPWKFLLLGKPSEAAYCDGLQTHMPDLKSMVYSAELNAEKEDYFPVDTLLKALLYGIPSLTNNEIEKCICCLLLKETVHGSISSHSILEGSACQDIIGKAAKELTSTFQRAASRKNHYKIYDNEPRKSSRKQKKQLRDEGSTECTSSESFLPCDLSNDFKNSSMTCIPREPVVLVLDANSQVLPWESLPIFRNQEVYRMPSVGSISAVMISRGHEPMVDSSDEKEKKMSKRKTNKVVRKNPWSIALEQLSKLPVMDPYNAFYLLNPSGDLSNTQSAFEDWFKNQQGWQGKSGEVPTPEECILALQKHDLFIYLGHGRGEQYIPERNIKRLDYCAAVVLMGCSSGRLSYKGDYEPVGVPLSYLIAGCPCIIANLWDVTDGDIDRFSRVLLHSWLEAKSSQCNDLNVTEEFKNLKISSENTVKRVPRARQILKDDKTKNTMDEVRTGSCIGECRGTCKLPYLIGASPVCYGIPTTIKNK